MYGYSNQGYYEEADATIQDYYAEAFADTKADCDAYAASEAEYMEEEYKAYEALMVDNHVTDYANYCEDMNWEKVLKKAYASLGA